MATDEENVATETVVDPAGPTVVDGGATTTVESGASPDDGDDRKPSSLGTVGRFRLEARLGAGGMGDVYRAYDPALDRAVALKLLHSKAGQEQMRRRVLREARAAAALTHPNTVTIFDVGEAHGEVFIAMELLAGETLRALIRRGDASFSLKMKWLVQAAKALGAAHERGLVHRDVKPDNIFVCAPGDTLKLLDFGIAKRDEETVDRDTDAQPESIGPSSLRTEAGVRVGTPRYMAPEQRAGEATDARTDQYAWGLVAFELLSGKHPIAAPATVTKGGPAPAITDQNISATLAAIPEVGKKVAAVIARTLEPRPDDRYSSMAEVIAELEPRELPEKAPRSMVWPSVLVVGGGLALTAGVAYFGTEAVAKKSGLPARAPAPAACHVLRSGSLPLEKDDRVAALPNGDLALARNTEKGLTLARQTADAGTPVPFTKNAGALRMLGTFEHNPDYEHISLKGIQFQGESWAFVAIEQGIERGIFLLGVTENSYVAQRLAPPISGLATSPFGKERFLVAATTFGGAPRFANLPSGAEIYILDGQTAPHPLNVEKGEAFAPSLAVSADNTRVAFAYGMAVPEHPDQHKMQLAILNEMGDRVSDIQTLRTAPPLAPAAAFSGPATAIVFWVQDLGTTRLRSSSFTPGDAAPTPAKVAIEEPAISLPPKTARLPNGEWTVAWASMDKNTPMLRVAPVRAGGTLGGPLSVAPLPPKFEHFSAWASDRGVLLSWQEIDAAGARTAKMAEVTCP